MKGMACQCWPAPSSIDGHQCSLLGCTLLQDSLKDSMLPLMPLSPLEGHGVTIRTAFPLAVWARPGVAERGWGTRHWCMAEPAPQNRRQRKVRRVCRPGPRPAGLPAAAATAPMPNLSRQGCSMAAAAAGASAPAGALVGTGIELQASAQVPQLPALHQVVLLTGSMHLAGRSCWGGWSWRGTPSQCDCICPLGRLEVTL